MVKKQAVYNQASQDILSVLEGYRLNSVEVAGVLSCLLAKVNDAKYFENSKEALGSKHS